MVKLFRRLSLNAKVKCIKIGPHLPQLFLKQDRQSLLKAKYCPRVAAVSYTPYVQRAQCACNIHTKYTQKPIRPWPFIHVYASDQPVQPQHTKNTKTPCDIDLWVWPCEFSGCRAVVEALGLGLT